MFAIASPAIAAAIDRAAPGVSAAREGMGAMKPAALTFVAAALSLALPAAAFAASPNRPGESYDQKVGGVTSTTPQKQQAQTGSNQNDDSGKCQGLKQRSQELSDSEAQSKD
ncbi:MAG TPA: hypothetical protein VKV32_12530, partial [Stellaceae bacterium]|nr:hypothetical protein [Stellaceae bacterium]